MGTNAPSILDGVNRLTQLAGRNRLELLLFSLAEKQRYGINVFKVREVIRCPQLTKVPDSKPGVCGLANIRGHTISVVDLSQMIGCGSIVGGTDQFVVVAEYNRHTIGFLVSDVHSIVNKNWEEIKAPPESLGNTGYLTAVTTIGEELIEILDVEHVLGDLIGVHPNALIEGIQTDIDTTGVEVFIADDSSVARKQLTRTMEELGISYRIATNGREALDMLLAMSQEDGAPPIERRLAMVISDIEMPEMDGYALTTAIRANPVLAHLYICLHTSLSGSFNKAMAERVGADRLIPKFDPKELALMVEQRLTSLAEEAAAA